MILLEYFRLIILVMPLGIFITFGLLVVVTLSLRHAKLEKVFQRILFFYCLSATIASFFLFMYYYRPLIFEYFDILYCASCIFSIVLFHHMLCFMIRFEKPFNKLYYIFAIVICVILLICKFAIPLLWSKDSTVFIMILILIFGIIHSLLSLFRLHQHQVQLSLLHHTSKAMDYSKAIPFIVEILLFPWVFAVCPLITGQNPGILATFILIPSIGLALRMNIPLTYGMLRHYAIPYNDTSLLATTISPDKSEEQHETNSVTSYLPVEQKNKDLGEKIKHTKEVDISPKTSKRVYRKYDDDNLYHGVLIEIEQKEFELYFRKQKPYLDPNLTISDVVKALQSNRTYLSKFINRVYGMNFNSYVNSWRLHEMKRLLAIPLNKEKTSNQLFKLAGFSAHRTYLRAKELDKNGENKSNKK